MLWIKDGKVVLDGTGKPILCPHCPCTTTSSGLCTACCSNPIPSSLTATITDAGGCACLAGTYTATWDGIGWRLQATLCGGNTIDMLLWCSGGAWALDDTHLVPGETAPTPSCQVGSTFSPTSVSCATFSVTFNSVGVAGPCCTGAALINVVFSGTVPTSCVCSCSDCNACMKTSINVTIGALTDVGGACGIPSCVFFTGGTYSLAYVSGCLWTATVQFNGGSGAGGQTFLLSLQRTSTTDWTFTLGWNLAFCQIALNGATYVLTGSGLDCTLPKTLPLSTHGGTACNVPASVTIS